MLTVYAMGRHLLAVATVVVAALLAPFGAGYPWPVCGTTNTFAANSTYEANLNRLAATLPGNASASPNLYASAVIGAVPEQVRAMALCRGDANATVCGSCLAQAFRDVQSDCPYYKDATIYYDTCTLHYSDVDTLAGDEDTGPTTDESGVTNLVTITSDPSRFKALRAALLNATADYAAFNSTRRFATGQADFFDKNFLKVYSLAQCPPDQPPARCRKCLAGIIADGLPKFLNSIGGRVLLVNCTYRFETAPFYNGPAMVRLQSPGVGAPAPGPTVETPPAAGAGRKGIAAAVSVGIAGFVVLMLMLSVFFFLRFGRKMIKATKKDHPMKEIGDPQCTVFDLKTLQEATEHFSERNKLGEGGFGTVYKGILSDSEEIAVKTILGRTGHALHQLHNEIQVLAKLQHKNLVRLLGYCLHQNDALLVYEYIKNGSLDSILFDKSTGNALQWKQQYNIILGIAKGILYLHEDSSTRIIHRDLKANNILLDDDMEPKIADFGLARLVGEGHTLTQTARVVGTFGYMAPEYAMHGLVSPKVDIFSFGVLALEIVTRRSNCGSGDYNAVNLLSDVWDHWTKGSISQMLDQSLDGYGRIQAMRCIHVGLLCVQVDPDDRPDISAVVFMLTRDDMDLQPPEEPAFLFARGSPSASRSAGQSRYVYDRFRSILEQYISVNGLTVTEPQPR